MKTRSTLALAAIAAFASVSAQDDKKPAEAAKPAEASKPAEAEKPAAVPMDKISYLMAHEILAMQKNQLGEQGLSINLEQYLAGARDSFDGKAMKYPKEELDAAYAAFQQHMATQSERMVAEQQKKGEAAKGKGAKYLADNGKRKEITTTASGLQYEVLKAGEGDKPKVTDTVSCHYKGTLIDGTEFDSSYKRGEPASFPLQGVIKGWTEALQLMPVGSKWKLHIPSELGYGEGGSPPNIGPNEALVFEVELLSIVK